MLLYSESLVAMERGNCISLPKDFCHFCYCWQDFSNNIHWLKPEQQITANKSTGMHPSANVWRSDLPSPAAFISSDQSRWPWTQLQPGMLNQSPADLTISPALCFAVGLFTMIILSWNYYFWLVWQTLLKSRLFGSFQVLIFFLENSFSPELLGVTHFVHKIFSLETILKEVQNQKSLLTNKLKHFNFKMFEQTGKEIYIFIFLLFFFNKTRFLEKLKHHALLVQPDLHFS